MSSDNESLSEKSIIIDQLLDLISKTDIDAINDMQKDLYVLDMFANNLFNFNFSKKRLTRFEKSNQMLMYCNELSNNHYSKLSKNFRTYTNKLNEMYKDLDSIFHRIRAAKRKLREKYPNISIG